MSLTLAATTRLLFIGDSITDVGRREDPEKIGHGYVRLLRDYFLATDPFSAPTVLNTGISGNRVTDLADRWQRDVLDLAPDILSIKIGINDVWHSLGGRSEGVEIERFARVYHGLLVQVRTFLPECKIVLCEPSVIWPPQPIEGNEKLQPYLAAVRELAATHGAECVVPLHEAFENARQARPDIDWAPDGVHPSSAGHMLIAQTWLAATGLG
jgi:lysophospholipase L1-like esterase